MIQVLKSIVSPSSSGLRGASSRAAITSHSSVPIASPWLFSSIALMSAVFTSSV
jgi:hypothetical protein